LEYEEIISVRSAPHVAANILKGFEDRPNIEHKIISYKWDLIKHDPDDNKFVDCYVTAGADYLVTNDHHFDILKPFRPKDFPPVRVVSIEAFLEIVQSQFGDENHGLFVTSAEPI